MNNTFHNDLNSVLKSYNVGFHVPGHNRGKIFKKLGYEDCINSNMDTTEIQGTDDLHEAEEFIKESQNRASSFFNSKKTFFIINGTTCGNQAMMLSVLNSGDSIIMGRDSHRSVYNGLILGDIRPIFIYPELREKDQLPLGYKPENIENALIENPEAKAVLITRPNYYGICSDIKAISEICKKYDVLLLVDEAHGSHLSLSDELPVSAVGNGADIVVQSIHKTLPSMTQTSLLHVCSDNIDVKRLSLMLQILQSSSPSYVLMNSIDKGVEITSKYGVKLMKDLIEEINKLQSKLTSFSEVDFLGSKVDGFERDITKLLIGMNSYGLTGIDLDSRLRNQYGVQLEMANASYGVGIATISNDSYDFDVLSDAIECLVRESINETNPVIKLVKYPKYEFESNEVLIKQAIYESQDYVLLDDAINRISAEFVIPYPPGIPILVPGERISKETIDYIKEIARLKYKIVGMSDLNKSKISVLASRRNLNG